MITEKQTLIIKKRLLEEKMTVTELSKKLGVARTFLSGVVSGKRNSKEIETYLKENYVRRR